MRRLGRIVKRIAVALAFVFFAAIGFLLWAFSSGRAGAYAKPRVLAELRERCDVEAEFKTFEVHPFPLEISMTGLVLDNTRHERLMAMEAAIVRLQVLPLLYGRVQLDQVSVLAPEAAIVYRDGRIANLPRCLAPPPKRRSGRRPRTRGPPRFRSRSASATSGSKKGASTFVPLGCPSRSTRSQ